MSGGRAWTGYAFALGAAACYGLNSVLIRQGLSAFGFPLVGATIALTVGVFVLLLLSLPDLGRGGGLRWPWLGLVLLSGASSAVGVACSYVALGMAPVAVVSPVTATSPLVTLLVARLFLRQSEPVTVRMVLGALLVVGGVAVITLSRATR